VAARILTRAILEFDQDLHENWLSTDS